MLLRKFLCVFLYFYLQIVNISCEGGSLAFAIDDTASMGDDIMYVKEGAQAIMRLVLLKKAHVKELVLVTFNDPDVVLRTKNSSQHTFLNDLNVIQPHGGGDCPEMALTGLEEALKNSKPGSYVYVFTDANAKDYNNLNKIQSLCQKKQSQVVIVYSEDRYCFRPTGVQFTVYYDIAKACSGQVFIVKKDQVNSVLKTIETLLQGKNYIFKWITVPRTDSYVSVKFTLDEKAEYAIISTSGNNVDLRVTRDVYFFSPQVNFEKTMWNVNGKVVKLIDPNPGTYYAWVKGDSTISVVIYGRTDFTFQHGFSILEPKLLTDTAKTPTAGLKQHVSVNVTDPDNSVNIQTVQILDIKNNEHVLNELPVRNIGKDFYITEAFVSPNHTFRIVVKGEIKMTHETITRMSNNIDPRIVDLIPESVPDVKIDEGTKLDVNYGSGVSLTCKVTAHPAPKIEWYTSSGHVLQSKSSVIDDPLFVSYLKLENIKQSESYICKASNNKGGRESRIQVGVRPIFSVIGEVVYNAKYGEDVKIPCNIKSDLPLKIKWFRSGVQISDDSGKHSISRDGTELILPSMDIGMQGKYTCKAILISDPTIEQTHDRDVKIPGLVHPKVTSASTVLKEKNFTAICRIEGVPKPIISWQFKANGSKVFSTISGSGDELNIPELRLKHTGAYKCIAKNVLGETEHDFNVVVEELPIINNEESIHYGVEGDLVMKIPCNVTGFPVPIIIWRKGGKALKIDSKYKIEGSSLYIHKPVQSDSAEYTCEAKNKLGTATKTVVVEVVDNFEGDDNFNGDTYDVYAEQGQPKTIKCNLKNVGKGLVRWYMDGLLTNQTGSTYTIKKASISDEGNYTCRVNTNEGSKSETYVVYVGYPPSFENNSPSPITINWPYDDQMLDCVADSQPPAKYEWAHNGKAVEAGNFVQQNIPITNWGEYTCQVSNVHGNISRTFKVTTKGCYITKNIATRNQPLVSDMDMPTWPPGVGNNDILLDENKEIKLSCPNTKISTNNFKILPSKKQMIAKCTTQDKFIVDGKTYRYSELQCNSKIEPSVLRTQQQCSGPNSEMIRVGFEVNGFLDAYRVCYDRSLNVPLYASASNQISRVSDGVDSNKFNWSSAPELGNTKTGNWKPEGSCKCCYTQGQLVSANELAFGPAQAATYKDNLNSVPIWNPSCDGSSRTSWQTFKNVIKETSLLHVKWSSWTGASGYVLTDGGLVPRYLWTVINNDDGFTVVVYVNDKSPVDSDVRCSSPCESLIEADKFLYCCTLNEFSRSFGLPLDKFKAV